MPSADRPNGHEAGTCIYFGHGGFALANVEWERKGQQVSPVKAEPCYIHESRGTPVCYRVPELLLKK
jgi:hypothetical protein